MKSKLSKKYILFFCIISIFLFNNQIFSFASNNSSSNYTVNSINEYIGDEESLETTNELVDSEISVTPENTTIPGVAVLSDFHDCWAPPVPNNGCDYCSSSNKFSIVNPIILASFIIIFILLFLSIILHVRKHKKEDINKNKTDNK